MDPGTGQETQNSLLVSSKVSFEYPDPDDEIGIDVAIKLKQFLRKKNKSHFFFETHHQNSKGLLL
jgi:hypothetical protein